MFPDMQGGRERARWVVMAVSGELAVEASLLEHRAMGEWRSRKTNRE